MITFTKEDASRLKRVQVLSRSMSAKQLAQTLALLPEDAIFVGVAPSGQTPYDSLIFQSKEFHQIDEGSVIPDFKVRLDVEAGEMKAVKEVSFDDMLGSI